MNAGIYELTLPMVGAENLITGLTLLILCMAKKYGRVHNKLGLRFFAVAMLNLSLINLAEFFFGTSGRMEYQSLAVVVFAASVELLLFLFAYMSMLDKRFVTIKRFVVESSLVLVFTLPAVFISSEHNPVVFHCAFVAGIVYYIAKLSHNLHIYKKNINRVAKEIENYSSDESSALLQWINNTFYMVLAVGMISIVVPLTNYTVLTLYNIFIFFAYLYIYVEIIRNIYVFEYNISTMQLSEQASLPEENPIQQSNGTEAKADLPDTGLPDTEATGNGFMNMNKEAFDKWLSLRPYAASEITADDIASQLGTNRTKLSIALKNELQVNFYEWIAYLRIEDAKRQLIEYPERPVCEIAVIVGIEDKSNFGRLFKRIVGVSPLVYRSEHLPPTKQDA